MDRPLRRAPHDIAAVSQALRALGELRHALDAILRDARDQIQRIEDQTRRRCAPLRRRARSLERGLERFCTAHPDLLGPARRLDLPEGSLGFATRQALRPAPGLAWAHIIPRLAAAGLPASPASPAGVDPHALAALPPAQLHALGIAAESRTRFWCTPKAEG